MRALRIVLLTLLTAALLSATSYAAGYALLQRDRGTTPQAAVEPQAPTTPATPTPTLPASPGPTFEPEFRLAPGDRGTQVRELQHRLFQLDWLPELTTGRYDAGHPRGRLRLPGAPWPRRRPGSSTSAPGCG